MTVGYEQYLEDLETYHKSGGELYGFEGAFKDFNEVLDFVEERGVQGLSNIANDIGSAGGLSAGAAGIAQALGSVLNQSYDSSNLTDIINKINNSRKFEVPYGVSKVVSNNYLGAAVISAYALNEFRENGDANAAAKTIVDSALAAPIGVAIGAIVSPVLILIPAVAASPFALAAIAGLAAAWAATNAVRELEERGFLDPLYDATESAITELFGWQPTPPPRRDPLILDLDGNGVSLTESTYFDHNANGIANRTEWVSSTDGLLALDRNGNGTIDSGRELFGDNTLDANGNTASDGYAALGVFDSNNDSVIDQEDEIFNQLKVWVDENSDGVSQEHELKTLSSLGIKSINLTHENLHSQYFDTQGESHATQSVFLDINNVDRRFVESIEVPDSFNDLPNMRGTGIVYDLHEAMTLSTQLKGQVEQFSTSNSREEQLKLSEEILFSWAKTSQYYDEHIPALSGSEIDKLYAIESFYGDKVSWSVSNAASLPTGLINSAYNSLVKMVYFELASQTRLKGYYDAITISSDRSGLYLSLDGALEQFGNHTPSPALLADAMDFTSAMSSTSTNRELTGFYTFISNALYGMSDSDIEQLQPALQFNGISISEVKGVKKVTFSEGAITFTEGTSTTEIEGSHGSDLISGTDLDDVIKLSGNRSSSNDKNQTNRFEGGQGNDTLFGGSGDDNYHFNMGDGQDRIYDSAGNDRIVFSDGITAENIDLKRNLTTVWVRLKDHDGNLTGDQIQIDNFFKSDGSLKEGVIESIVLSDGTTLDLQQMAEALASTPSENDDFLLGTSEADQISGLAGADDIYGFAGDDILNGGEGNDTLSGDAGNDTLIGGAGNDTLNGGAGSDIYVFNIGSGQDIIHNYDTTADRKDILKFGEGIAPESLELEKSGNDLIIRIEHTDDQVTISEWFKHSNYQLQGFEFTQGATLTFSDLATLNSLKIIGSDDADTLQGYAWDDEIFGGQQKDYLYGNEGNDLLDGGAGNDTLYGGSGNDTYQFNRGGGMDKIIESGTAGDTDTLRFGEGISIDDLYVQTQGYDLLIKLRDGSSEVSISGWFRTPNNQVEVFEFADGSTLSQSEFLALAIHEGTEGNDTLKGSEGDNWLCRKYRLGGDRPVLQTLLACEGIELFGGRCSFKVNLTSFNHGPQLSTMKAGCRSL